MSRYLQVAMQAVNAMERITVEYYHRKPKVRTKADRSPVTIADLRSEREAVRIILKHFPSHAILGEEGGHRDTGSDFTWIIDPIDGTKNFVRRIPLWGNLLALYHHGEVILGISNVPLLNERLWAERGKGAFLNGSRVRVSRIGRLREAMLSYSSLPSFRNHGHDTGLCRLLDACSRTRAFGDLWPYHLLASGRIEIVAEAKIRAYDVAPFVCILKEAGGRCSDLAGEQFTLDIRSFVATNGLLHRQVVKHFR